MGQNDGKTPPLTSAYDELVRTIEVLSGRKLSDFNIGAVRESFAQMKEREAREIAQELAKDRQKSSQAFAEHLYKEGAVDRKWQFQNLVQDANNIEAITAGMAFCRETLSPAAGTRPKLLLVFGKEGTGKTVLLNAMANAYLLYGVQSLDLIGFDAILNACYFQSDEHRNDRMERYEEWEHYCNTHVLLLDGLGHITDGFNLFEQRIFSKLVRLRAAAGLPLVISTNLTFDNFSAAIGTFAYESLKEYDSLCVMLAGISRRPPISFKGRPIR